MQETTMPYKMWLYKFIGGGAIGLANATITTPFANYNNHLVHQRANASSKPMAFTFVRAFDGLFWYQASFVLRVSVTLSLNSAFLHLLSTHQSIEHQHNLLTSIISGGIAGAVAIVPEGIAQTQQLNTPKPSAQSIIKKAYQCNGIFGMHRGVSALMARSAGLTTGYLVLMPMLSEQLQKEIGNTFIADTIASMVSGFAVGIFTTPFNVLRAKMQHNFITHDSNKPTYRAILKEASLCDLFTGFKPRTIQSIISMFVIAKGNQLCGELYEKNGFPDFPSLKPS